MISIARERHSRLRRPGDALASTSIGTVPILWQHVDEDSGRPVPGPMTILDEIARTGYEGIQLGAGFPEGEALRGELAGRGLRLAEVYAALPASVHGPADWALEVGLERLRLLVEGGGDVLCVALDGSPEREGWAGRADDPGTPRFTDRAWDELGSLLDALADHTTEAGRRLVFHPHAATFVETPDEMDRLVSVTDPGRVGICLDTGHDLVGGGDPVETIRRLGSRLTHVHLKDVDPDVLEELEAGTLEGLGQAVRLRIFTELGSGSLDLLGCVRALAGIGYEGWLMVEQDSSWPPPSEAAAIGRRVLAHALSTVGAELVGRA